MELLLWLLLLYFKVVAVLVALTFLLYMYELVNNQGPAWLGEKMRGAPLLGLLRCMVIAFCSQCLVGLAYATGFVRKWWRPRSPRNDGLPAVVLVHGLYHNASAWLVFRRLLRRAGFLNIHGITYNSWNTDFHKVFNELEDFVREVVIQHPDQGVVLMGHSLGGLLTRHYMAVGKDRDLVRAAITLGAPHKGSRLAAFGLGRLARSLLAGSDLIRSIEASDTTPPSPCLSLYSPVDEFVLPQQTLRLELEGWEERECLPVSHVGLLFHPAVARECIEYLRRTTEASA
jgi:triacylglycerol lipase